MTDLRTSLHGLWLPLVTPFRNGELDEASLRRLVRHYAALPVNGLILAATTGESLTLAPGETERLVFTVRDEAAAKSSALPRPVRQQHTRVAGHAGANGGVADRRIPDFLPVLFAAVAARPRSFTSARSPIAPRIRSCSTTFPTGPASISATRRCCGWPVIRTSSGSRIAARTATSRSICCAGARKTSPFSPARMRNIMRRWSMAPTAAFWRPRISKPKPSPRSASCMAAGERDAALARWRSVADLTRLLFAEPSPAPIKYWLWRTGLIDSAEVRLPMTEVSAELAARLDLEIERRSHRHCEEPTGPAFGRPDDKLRDEAIHLSSRGLLR